MVSAQVCVHPTASAATVLGPGMSTVTGELRRVRVPSPSWPSLFDPQHSTLRALDIPQVWSRPALTSRNATVELMRTGALRGCVVASPSWPDALAPQQKTSAREVRPQVCL